jgi:hypothetical protein
LLLVFASEADIAAVLRFIQLFYGHSEDLEICNHQDNLFRIWKGQCDMTDIDVKGKAGPIRGRGGP